MTKYTRSIQSLALLIKDIFNYSGISLDTKVILLFLAATMSPTKFLVFIAGMDHIDILKTKLLKINALRAEYGADFRDYIIIRVMQAAKGEVSSDELQQLISNVTGESVDDLQQELSPALAVMHVNLEENLALQKAQPGFAQVLQQANDFLVAKLPLVASNHLNTIVDTYLHCRTQENPETAYYATIHAMADIMTAGGLEAKDALMHSYNLAKRALHDFTDAAQNNSILSIYDGIVRDM